MRIPRSWRHRINEFLDQRQYVVTGGSRACTMCGVNGQDCLVNLSEGDRTACCAACHNGNTHPAPGENDGLCSEWSAKAGDES